MFFKKKIQPKNEKKNKKKKKKKKENMEQGLFASQSQTDGYIYRSTIHFGLQWPTDLQQLASRGSNLPGKWQRQRGLNGGAAARLRGAAVSFAIVVSYRRLLLWFLFFRVYLSFFLSLSVLGFFSVSFADLFRRFSRFFDWSRVNY